MSKEPQELPPPHAYTDERWTKEEWTLFVLLGVPALSLYLWQSFKTWWQLRSYVSAPLEVAWSKCSEFWSSDGIVAMYAAHHTTTPFGHELAVALGKRHKKQWRFFREQLSHPNPALAAYAFKCLVHAKDIEITDIPESVLERTDEFPDLWADLMGTQRLGSWIEHYFLYQSLG